MGSGSGVLFRMAKGGEMELLTQLSEGDLATLRPGNSATVTPVGSQTEFSGRVWQVSPVVDPQTRQGIARIAIPYNKEIRPGGFAAARIVSGTATAPLLPESAIQTDAKGHFVYVINGRNEAERRGVEVGQVSPKGVPVTRGLNGGERIVASAGAFLRPGQKVRPQVQKAG